MNVPPIIWTVWLQGWHEAPELVRACRDSWRTQNPTWDVRALDRGDVESLLPGLTPRDRLAPATYADRIRLELLRRYGGVWADATTFAMTPLDSWLGSVTTNDFFAFSNPAPGRPIANWFLAAAPGGVVIERWAVAAADYWCGRSTPDFYFWSHYLFGNLQRTDPIFARAWRATPRISADGAHYFAPYGRRFSSPLNQRQRARLGSRPDPIYKLTHHVDPVEMMTNSAYDYFLRGARDRMHPNNRLAWIDRNVERVRRLSLDCGEGAREVARRARHTLRQVTNSNGR